MTMAPMVAHEDRDLDWSRLGRLLRDRREAMGLTLVELAGQHGMSDRTLADLETARRAGRFRAATLTAVEVAYGLEPGAIDRVLHGGDLTPPDKPQRYAHPHDQAVWELDIPEDQRLLLISVLQEDRSSREQNDTSRHSRRIS